jgi:hypothetical protein
LAHEIIELTGGVRIVIEFGAGRDAAYAANFIRSHVYIKPKKFRNVSRKKCAERPFTAQYTRPLRQLAALREAMRLRLSY